MYVHGILMARSYPISLSLSLFSYNVLQMDGTSNVHNELIGRFIFPNRPGALMKFLDTFSPRWNISLLHYRAQVPFRNLILLVPLSHCSVLILSCCVSAIIFEFTFFASTWKGETGANVLIGIQVPEDEVDEFRDQADSLGYEYAVETLNEAFQELMHWNSWYA